jgi:hypothetical protein
MPKVALNIFKIGEEYRAVMQIGNHAEPKSMGIIVYQDGEDLETTTGTMGVKDSRGIIRMLNERARKWAREQGIPFVHNLDINPYD